MTTGAINTAGLLMRNPNTDTPTPDAIKARLRQILTAYVWQELLTVKDIQELAEEQARLEDMLEPTEDAMRAFARVA